MAKKTDADDLPLTPLVAFTALKDEVAKDLEAGHTAKAVWAKFNKRGAFPFRYETFLRHVKTRIKGDTPAKTRPAAATASKPAKVIPPKPVEQEKDEFKFDPHILNKEEDY